jgi:hypothetical protein
MHTSPEGTAAYLFIKRVTKTELSGHVLKNGLHHALFPAVTCPEVISSD